MLQTRSATAVDETGAHSLHSMSGDSALIVPPLPPVDSEATQQTSDLSTPDSHEQTNGPVDTSHGEISAPGAGASEVAFEVGDTDAALLAKEGHSDQNNIV